MYPMIHAKAGARKPRLDKRRATGRIEHTLLDGEFSVRPNRPKNLRPQPHHTTESDRCFYLRQRAGARGRKAKAALSYRDGLNNAANNTRIIKAGTPRRIPRRVRLLLVRKPFPNTEQLVKAYLLEFVGTQVASYCHVNLL